MANELEVMKPHVDAPVTYAPRSELTVEELVSQVAKIQEVMTRLMHEGEHYGTIPGTKKKSLYKAGAEKLCMVFRLRPEYHTQEIWDGPHLTIKSTCVLYHIPTGEARGSGEGSCSTRESKYAYRKGERKCPECGGEFIIKGQAQYGGGWLCWKKRGGCGAKFNDDDKAITEQNTERVANEDLADSYNTVLKMANKRSRTEACLSATAASDIFTQDVEDFASEAPAKPEPFRPTPEQLRRSREDPLEPSEPPPADMQEGFGEDSTSWPVVTKEQLAAIRKACTQRAKETGHKAKMIGDLLLEVFQVQQPEHLPRERYGEILQWIALYPDESAPAAEPDWQGDAQP